MYREWFTLSNVLVKSVWIKSSWDLVEKVSNMNLWKVKLFMVLDLLLIKPC
jgi:hypothetical protein